MINHQTKYIVRVEYTPGDSGQRVPILREFLSEDNCIIFVENLKDNCTGVVVTDYIKVEATELNYPPVIEVAPG